MSNITTDYMGYTVIATGEDAARYATPEVAMTAYADDLYQYISDASKDCLGFRQRLDISSMTFEQLNTECTYWSEQVSVTMDQEKKISAQAVEEFKALVQRTIEMGAGNEATALRWLIQDEQDVEHWVYTQGILFTDYGSELVKRLVSIVNNSEAA